MATQRGEPEANSDVHEQVLQPEYYAHFRCLANDCPDTCCEGWRVGIDKTTYGKYQQSTDPVLKPKFEQLVTINPARTTDDQYATFVTSGGRCSFLSEGLCSIQQRLGESLLGAACAAFPRIRNLVGGSLERSMDLSCPEAARLALLNPQPMAFTLLDPDPQEQQSTVAEPRYGRMFSGAFAGSASALNDRDVVRVRRFVLSILQNRKYPVSKRLILLGHVCDKLNDIAAKHDFTATPAVLEGFARAIDEGLFDDHLNRCGANPSTQLAIILELIVQRLKSDFTHRRFLELYQEFLQGICWVPGMSLQQAASQYAEAYQQYYLPVMSRHDYVLEHYLVNNAFKTMFPFGSQSLNRALNLEPARTIIGQFIVMTTYYAIAKAMLIGVAGYHREAFNLDAVVKTVQICSKTFEHSITYPRRILEILSENGIDNSAGMTVLTQN